MKQYHNQYFEGERPLFAETNAVIEGTTFGKGESPLKESQNIQLTDSIFTWKYPLWYSRHIQVTHSILETMARSGTPMIFRLKTVQFKHPRFSVAAQISG